MALLHRVFRECGWSLNLGVRSVPESWQRDDCVRWERELIKRTHVCLTDTEGSLSSNNNSLMKVCVCKGIRAAVVMNHEAHQSCVIDQIPNSRLTEINTAAMCRAGRTAAVHICSFIRMLSWAAVMIDFLPSNQIILSNYDAFSDTFWIISLLLMWCWCACVHHCQASIFQNLSMIYLFFKNTTKRPKTLSNCAKLSCRRC